MASAFDNLAPRYIADLVRVLGLTPEQASGVPGNGGAESRLLAVNEKRPLVPGSAGGFGHFQWTGPRRRAFFAWCKAKGLDPESYEANFGFLVHELQTTHKDALRHLRMTKTAKAAAETFGYHFEKFAGYQNLNSANYRHRIQLAERALALYRAKYPVGRTPAPVEPAPMPPPAPPVVAQPDPVLPPKPWYTSRTIVGGIVGILLPYLARYVPGLAGIPLAGATEVLIQMLEVVGPPVGLALVTIGRIAMTRPIAGTQAAQKVEESRFAREYALQEARAEVPPGYVPESATPADGASEPVSEAWDRTKPFQPADDLAGLIARTPFQQVVEQAAAVAPYVTAALHVAKMLNEAREREPDPQT